MPGPAVTLVDTNDAPIGSASGLPVTNPAPVTVYSENAQARTTNGNTGTLAWPANVATAFVGINVTGFAGGTSFTVALQQMDANGVWQTLVTTAAITVTGAVTFSVGPGTANNSMIVAGGSYRLVWTLTGVFTTLLFQIGIQGR